MVLDRRPEHVATQSDNGRHMAWPRATGRNFPQRLVTVSKVVRREHRQWSGMLARGPRGMWRNDPSDLFYFLVSVSTRDRTVAKKSKGLRDRNSPSCTLSQNGYGADR